MQDPDDALRELANAASGDFTPDDSDTASGDGPDAEDADQADEKPQAPASSRPESPLAKDPPQNPATSRRPESPIQANADAPTMIISDQDAAEASASALEQLSGASMSAASMSASASRSMSRRRGPAKPDVGSIQMRLIAIPVLVTFGLLLGAIGIWSILVMAGVDALPMADDPDAKTKATVGLVGLPLALCLFGGAGFFLFTVRKDKQKLARWEAAQQEA